MQMPRPSVLILAVRQMLMKGWQILLQLRPVHSTFHQENEPSDFITSFRLTHMRILSPSSGTYYPYLFYMRGIQVVRLDHLYMSVKRMGSQTMNFGNIGKFLFDNNFFEQADCTGGGYGITGNSLYTPYATMPSTLCYTSVCPGCFVGSQAANRTS